MNRATRRAGMAKPGYGPGARGCPHTRAKFFTISDESSTLSRATYPCVKPPGHDGPHRTQGGREWT